VSGRDAILRMNKNSDTRGVDTMTEQVEDLDAVLKDNDIYANILQYNSSFLEPLEVGSLTNLFSDENRRLTEKESRYQLYNELGGYYANGIDLDDLFAKIRDIQESGMPDIVPYEAVDLAGIASMIQALQGAVSVYGTRQQIYDSWSVLDDQLLEQALYRESQTEEQQLSLVAEDDEDYLVDNDNHKVLIRQSLSEQIGVLDAEYYEIRTPDNHVVLNEIPIEKLQLVLLSLINRFTFGQAESNFLWPKLSKDLLSSSKLIFERNFCSDDQEITTEADFEKIGKLPIYQDNDHLVSIYQFYGGKRGLSTLGLPVPEYEFIPMYNHLYHNQSDDSQEITQKLSDFILGLADDFDVIVLRKERHLMGVADLKSLTISEKGEVKNGGDPRSNSSSPMLENVFTLVDKKSPDILIKQDITINELVSYFLSRANQAHKND